MRLLFHLIVLAMQCVITFAVLLIIYMLFVLLDYRGGIDGFIGTTFVQPVIGSIIAVITMLVCLLVGLPIRLIKKLNAWWSEKYFLPIVGAFIGVVLLFVSALPAFQEQVRTEIDGQPAVRETPNAAAMLSGWFITAFFILHIYPPEKLKQWVRGQSSKLKLF